jgi:hypothetical protein
MENPNSFRLIAATILDTSLALPSSLEFGLESGENMAFAVKDGF